MIVSCPGRMVVSISSVLVTVYWPARRPGMSRTIGSDPVLIRIVPAVTVRRPLPESMLTVCGSVNAAVPVITVTVSISFSPS